MVTTAVKMAMMVKLASLQSIEPWNRLPGEGRRACGSHERGVTVGSEEEPGEEETEGTEPVGRPLCHSQGDKLIPAQGGVWNGL